MGLDGALGEKQRTLEISIRFRRVIERRIERLEADAARDESAVWQLMDSDHIRRQLRLVAVQRAEAMRMRQFLEQSGTRAPRPSNAL